MIPGPPQPRAALRRPARALPRAVRRVLRPPARAHGDVRVRATRRTASAPGSRGQARPARARGPAARARAATRSWRNQCASCHAIRGTRGRGQRRARPHARGRAHDARGADDPQRPARARATGSRDPQHVKPGNRMPAPRPGDARRPRARRLPGEPALAMAVVGTPAGRCAIERLERIWAERAGRARLADDDRPQADRAPLPVRVARVLRRRRRRGAARSARS